jgi:O-antigen/teichoic acid export membrane protein
VSSTATRGSYRSGFAFGILSFMVLTAIGVVSTIVTARLYGIRAIGQFALVLAPVSALWVLSTVKEQQALIKEISRLPPRHPRVTQLFAVVFTFSSTLTLLVTALAAVACWFVFRGPLRAPALVAPTFVNLAGYALLTNTGWNVDSILSAFVAGRQLFWVRLHEISSFVMTATAVGLIWRSVWGLVIATVVASLTSLVHRAIAARAFIRPHLSWAEYRQGLDALPGLLRFGLKATPGQIAQGISQQGGVWAVGVVSSVAVVGAYSRALFIPQRLQQVSMRVNEVLYPTLVGRHARGEDDGFDRALIDSIRYEAAGMLMIAAAIGGAAHAVLELFGPGFTRATSALALLSLYPALASVTVAQTQALWAIDRPGLTSVVAGVRLAVTMALLVTLTPAIGIVGPAIALLAGYVVVIALNGVALRSTLSRPLRAIWSLRERLALVAACGAGFLVATLIEHSIPSAAALPLSFGASALAYVLVLVAAGGLNARDRARLGELLERARAWRAPHVGEQRALP